MFQTQLLLSHLTIGKFQNAKNKFPTIIQAGELEFLVVVRVRWMILVHLLLNAHWTSSAMSGLVLGLVGAKKIQFQSSIRAGKPGDILSCSPNLQGQSARSLQRTCDNTFLYTIHVTSSLLSGPQIGPSDWQRNQKAIKTKSHMFQFLVLSSECRWRAKFECWGTVPIKPKKTEFTLYVPKYFLFLQIFRIIIP